MTYETPGATGSFLRQTAKYLPGANTSVASTATQYSYYGATETRDNPCTTGTEAHKQGGMLKLKTEPDPDGAGSQTPRTAETIYDDVGKIVATRYNTDNWTCTTYDSRERVSLIVVPAYGGDAARTVENDYAVGGSPLVTTSWDGNGWIVVWSDLLGRTTKYRDVHDDETVTTYDDLGKITQRVSPLGTETFVYDNLNRMTDQKLDNITYAHVIYDAYSRTDNVTYPAAGQMKLQYARDALGRTSSYTYTMGNGTTTVNDSVTRTQSGQITTDVVESGSNSLWYNYSYDTIGRLSGASVGANTFSYGYGAQNTTTCGTSNATNPNSGKNSNRTSQTVNYTTTTFCYDQADRLKASSSALYNGGDYDSHGNMTSLGSGTTPLRLCFDSSDRNTCMTQRDSSGNGIAMYYSRDVQGRIVARYKNTLTNWNAAAAGDYYYGFTGPGDSPDFVRDENWTVSEKNLRLPGGVLLTIRPGLTGNAQKQYGMPNIHGDTLLTADATGTNTSTGNGPANTFTYDPFGNILGGSTFPANAGQASYGWVGTHQKLSESNFATAPIQMGARVYIPGIGRFMQVDLVDGGTPSAYVYPPDPINSFDLDGSKTRRKPWEVVRYFTYVDPRSAKKAFKSFCGNSLVNVAWNCAPGVGSVGKTTKAVQVAKRAPAIGKIVTKLSKVPVKAKEMLKLITKSEGEKIPGYKSRPYHNVSQPKLPNGGIYREYDIHPFVKGEMRGPERLVRDADTGDVWYSPDHYNTWIKMN